MRRSRLIGRSFKLDAETQNLLSSDSDEEECWEERRKQGKTLLRSGETDEVDR